MRKPSIFEALIFHDHDRIREIIASGQHPLTIIEQCIEMRADAIDVLMMHVPQDCSESAQTVARVIKHLQMIDRYPHALTVLEQWISNCEMPGVAT